MKILTPLFLFLLLFTCCKSQRNTTGNAQTSLPKKDTVVSRFLPYAYFQFEHDQYRTIGKSKPAVYDVSSADKKYNQTLSFADSLSPCGSCWVSGKTKERQQIMFDKAVPLPPAKLSSFTIEMALLLDPDSMDTYRMGFADGQIVVSPGAISFALVNAQGKPDPENRLTIDNDGRSGLTAYLYDGNWHHLAFVFYGDTTNGTGMLRFIIDGKSGKTFTKRVKSCWSLAGNRFGTGFLPENHSQQDGMDELAIWFEELPDGLIAKHYREFFEGKHYSESLFGGDMTNAPLPAFELQSRNYNPQDFAPGFPQYTVSQQEQLETFPLPRFKEGNEAPRNFPWFDFTYTTYNYAQVKADTVSIKYPGWKGKEHALAALALDTEMYYHWNYYFLVPGPTFNSGDYADKSTISGKLIKFADQHPEVETSTILFWTGLRPDRAGFSSKTPYIRQNKAISPCDGDTIFPGIVNDGLTQRKNLEIMMRALPHRDSLCKINFVNENGEVFGESRTPNAEGYRNSSLISCIQKDSATARTDRAHWQYRVFSNYSKQFANTKEFPPLLNTHFSFYQVAGFMPQYYSEYTEMRKVNAKFRGMYYSTPDFYPGQKKWNIWETHGPYHGLDAVQQGRKYEISKGDAYFSPFICAGWSTDSTCFRPAEWLAATKALAMMGAEFFYPAYFNTVNPAKKIPQDPRGYIYQVAIPVYAQAVTSYYEDVFYGSKSFVYMRNYNRLTMYRKDSLRPVYVIHASVFPGTNYADALENSISGKVNIDGDILDVNFRPQGSTYVYDKSDPQHIVFYQLDAWHESKHPYYWSRNFDFEAELYSDSTKFHLRTERPAGTAANNYTAFTTYVYFTNANEIKNPLRYDFEPRATDTASYYIWVRARSSAQKSSAQISIGVQSFTLNEIAAGEFRWYCVNVKGKPQAIKPEAGKAQQVRIKALDKNLEIDRIVLSLNPAAAE